MTSMLILLCYIASTQFCLAINVVMLLLSSSFLLLSLLLLVISVRLLVFVPFSLHLPFKIIIIIGIFAAIGNGTFVSFLSFSSTCIQLMASFSQMCVSVFLLPLFISLPFSLGPAFGVFTVIQLNFPFPLAIWNHRSNCIFAQVKLNLALEKIIRKYQKCHQNLWLCVHSIAYYMANETVRQSFQNCNIYFIAIADFSAHFFLFSSFLFQFSFLKSATNTLNFTIFYLPVFWKHFNNSHVAKEWHFNVAKGNLNILVVF